MSGNDRTRGIMKLTKEEKLKYVKQYITGEKIANISKMKRFLVLARY